MSFWRTYSAVLSFFLLAALATSSAHANMVGTQLEFVSAGSQGTLSIYGGRVVGEEIVFDFVNAYGTDNNGFHVCGSDECMMFLETGPLMANGGAEYEFVGGRFDVQFDANYSGYILGSFPEAQVLIDADQMIFEASGIDFKSKNLMNYFFDDTNYYYFSLQF